MSEVLIKVDHLSKKFCRSLKRSMYYGVTDTLKTMAGVNYSTDTLRPSEFWSLNDISFELRKGETLGILGANGSGKSTLLRLLAGIFPPDHGKIEINGNIGALIAVGAGFHPHMTGYENIYLNGTILGLTKDRIDEIIDEITDFSEIPEDALNAPVATYSSGMKVRLGFSVAMHCEPDILLVDEVLSVGDIGFKNKALKRMSKYRKKAKGIIFISHDTEQVRVLCDRVIILDRGKIIYSGNINEGIVKYEGHINKIERNIVNYKTKSLRGNFHDNVIELINLSILDTNGEIISCLDVSDKLIVNFKIKINKYVEGLFIYLDVLKTDDNTKSISVVSNDNSKLILEDLDPGNYLLNVEIDSHHLIPSNYELRISFRNSVTFETYYRPFDGMEVFTVQAQSQNKFNRGVINVDEVWSYTRF